MEKTSTMENISKHRLIITLIKAELKNNKLIQGLREAGMEAEDFYVDLGTTILSLIGFKEEELEDEVYDFYDQAIDDLVKTHLNSFNEKLNYLSLDFYNQLLQYKIKKPGSRIKQI